MLRALAVALLGAAHTAAFAPGGFVPSLISTRPTLQQASALPLRERRATVSMTATPQGLKASCKKFVATAAMSLCLLAGTPMKASAQATATDFDFEEDLADDDMGLVETVDVEIEYTGMRKLTFGEEVAKYGILTGIFGGGVAWSWWEGKREDREEEKRVKEEVERIEKWKAEFIDMDDVVSDDDMLASLQKRMSGEGKEDVEGLDGSGAVPEDYNPDAVILQDQLKKMEKEQKMKEEAAAKAEEERFEALKNELTEEAEEDKVAEVDAEQMERLKRMFGGAGDGGGTVEGEGDAKKKD